MPPVNDNFANATVITGSSGTADGTLVDATQDFPSSEFLFGTNVWYEWVCPASGRYSFDTFALSTAAENATDTTLTAYRLIDPDSTWNISLVGVGENDDSTDAPAGKELRSKMYFGAKAGVTYWIEVGSFDDPPGAFRLSWQHDPATGRPPRPVIVFGSPEDFDNSAIGPGNLFSMVLGDPSNSNEQVVIDAGVYEWQIYRRLGVDGTEELLTSILPGDTLEGAEQWNGEPNLNDSLASSITNENFFLAEAYYYDPIADSEYPVWYRVKAINENGESDWGVVTYTVRYDDWDLSDPDNVIDAQRDVYTTSRYLYYAGPYFRIAEQDVVAEGTVTGNSLTLTLTRDIQYSGEIAAIYLIVAVASHDTVEVVTSENPGIRAETDMIVTVDSNSSFEDSGPYLTSNEQVGIGWGFIPLSPYTHMGLTFWAIYIPNGMEEGDTITITPRNRAATIDWMSARAHLFSGFDAVQNLPPDSYLFTIGFSSQQCPSEVDQPGVVTVGGFPGHDETIGPYDRKFVPRRGGLEVYGAATTPAYSGTGSPYSSGPNHGSVILGEKLISDHLTLFGQVGGVVGSGGGGLGE